MQSHSYNLLTPNCLTKNSTSEWSKPMRLFIFRIQTEWKIQSQKTGPFCLVLDHFVSLGPFEIQTQTNAGFSMVGVWISAVFWIDVFTWTIVQTSRGRYVCLCSWPTWRQGRWGNRSFILYLSKKYLATVHSTVWPFSNYKKLTKNNISGSSKTEGVRYLYGWMCSVCFPDYSGGSNT